MLVRKFLVGSLWELFECNGLEEKAICIENTVTL